MSRSDSESGRGGNGTAGAGTTIVNSMDQLMKLPLQMTGATWDFMMQGMRNMTGTGHQPRTTETNTVVRAAQAGLGAGSNQGSDLNARSQSEGETMSHTSSTQTESRSQSQWQAANPQDLGGDDLKYITWSLIFTKPGYECVLEPQHNELVNYDADVPSFAAVKIAKFLDKARHGHAEKAESWRDQNYPPEHSRTEVRSSESRTEVISESSTSSSNSSNSGNGDRGWRLPSDDQKYIMFLHRVEWRLPKQEEVARVERVTIERGTTRIA